MVDNNQPKKRYQLLHNIAKHIPSEPTINCHTDESIEQLRKELGFTRKKSTYALRLLLTNLLHSPNIDILVSRRNKRYITDSGEPLGVGSKALKTALDKLAGTGFIKQKKGNKLDNKMTTIRGTKQLKHWFELNKWSNSDECALDIPQITLRLNEEKRYIAYETTPHSKWLDEELTKYNLLLNASNILLPNEKGLLEQAESITTVRRYIKHTTNPTNGELLFGGRLVGSWSSISSKARKKITINGEPTCELDREASHLNAMYEAITGEPYQLGDPYTLTVDGIEIPRHIVKKLAAFSQGAKTAKGAIASVGKDYKKEAVKKDAKESSKDKLNVWEYHIRKLTGIKIHQALMDKHHLIKDYYLRGKQFGDFISCLEADLVFEVVLELTKRNIPCLTVYDSFIVQLKHKRETESVMKSIKFVDRSGVSRSLFKKIATN